MNVKLEVRKYETQKLQWCADIQPGTMGSIENYSERNKGLIVVRNPRLTAPSAWPTIHLVPLTLPGAAAELHQLSSENRLAALPTGWLYVCHYVSLEGETGYLSVKDQIPTGNGYQQITLIDQMR